MYSGCHHTIAVTFFYVIIDTSLHDVIITVTNTNRKKFRRKEKNALGSKHLSTHKT